VSLICLIRFQVKAIGRRDVTEHPEIVKAYLAMGEDERGAATKTSYQLDCVYEWSLMKQGMAKVGSIAQVWFCNTSQVETHPSLTPYSLILNQTHLLSPHVHPVLTKTHLLSLTLHPSFYAKTDVFH